MIFEIGSLIIYCVFVKHEMEDGIGWANNLFPFFDIPWLFSCLGFNIFCYLDLIHHYLILIFAGNEQVSGWFDSNWNLKNENKC